MADQAAQLPKCIQGAYLSGTQSTTETTTITRRLLRRELDILYVAPERLQSKRFIDLLKRVPISFACVDEAHTGKFKYLV